MMSIGSISLSGQTNDPLVRAASILPHIKEGNQIYTDQVTKINKLEGIVQKQDEEVYKLTLGLDQCISERKDVDNRNINMGLQIKGQQAIMSKQSTVIKIMAGIAASAITYTVYRELKQ